MGWTSVRGVIQYILSGANDRGYFCSNTDAGSNPGTLVVIAPGERSAVSLTSDT